MQVEELLRTHPSLGDFISQTKLEALDLTKQLELHIKSGYFEIVKAAEQLMKLSSSVKSAKELISPLPTSAPVELHLNATVERSEDEVWAEIDQGRFAHASKVCVAAMKGECSEEMRDIYYYLREVALPALAYDSESTVANKLAACAIVYTYEKTAPDDGDIGPVLLGTFISRLLTDLETVVSTLDFNGIHLLDTLLTAAQRHYYHCFVGGGVVEALREVGVDGDVRVQAEWEQRIAAALQKIVSKVTEKVSCVIEGVHEPLKILELKLGGVEKHGIFSLKKLAQPIWLHQLHSQSFRYLTEFRFLQVAPLPSPLCLAYDSEMSPLLSALYPFAADPELSPTLTQIVTEHLDCLSERVTALGSSLDSSSVVLTLCYFLHTVSTHSGSLHALCESLDIPASDRHSRLFPIWTAKVTGRDTLAVLREVREVCGDEVDFCRSVLHVACPQRLDPSKATISAVFGLESDEERTEIPQRPLADLPQLPCLQLLPRFSPHLVYT